jgi:hypothetical protein
LPPRSTFRPAPTLLMLRSRPQAGVSKHAGTAPWGGSDGAPAPQPCVFQAPTSLMLRSRPTAGVSKHAAPLGRASAGPGDREARP